MSYWAVFGTLIGTFCLDIMSQIIFSEKGSEVVVASKADGTIYFLHNKTSEFDDLELQGFTVMNDPVLALAWDPKASKGGPVFWLWNSSITPPPLYYVLRFSNLLYRVLKLESTCVAKFSVLSQSIEWAHTAGDSELHVLVSLARGEIVKLKFPMERPPGISLQFDHAALQRLRSLALLIRKV